ncbi:hypothetical protein D8767_22360 [Pseudomonas sp. LTGT-11-2Z]|nr:hypothetical protein D8767_22360 [Pseudomonas sp. LTGT-11-2Z]GJB83963.1 hypothetical protein KAM380_084280 [Aeromonas caviae]
MDQSTKDAIESISNQVISATRDRRVTHSTVELGKSNHEEIKQGVARVLSEAFPDSQISVSVFGAGTLRVSITHPQ